jgi:hypothetical protein
MHAFTHHLKEQSALAAASVEQAQQIKTEISHLEQEAKEAERRAHLALT